MEWLTFRDPVSTWTHGVWLLLVLPATCVLSQAGRGDPLKRVGFLVFGLSAALCFAGSALYHAVRLPREQIGFFETLDHIGIYVFIAGTITPVALVVLSGRWQRGVLGTAWLAAGAGTAFCLVYGDDVPGTLCTGLYLGMGWGIVGCYLVLVRALSHRKLRPAVVGGVLYSVGAILNLLHWPVVYPGVFEAHELFHLFVMAGSLAHFHFMLTTVAAFDRSGLRLAVAEPALSTSPLDAMLLSRQAS